MKRRGYADGELPERLIHYRAGDWVGRNDLDPQPERATDPPPARWSRSHRAWARNARSLDELNALYPPDLVMPPEADPRIDRDVLP
ncbi:MAG: hypothetical protein ACRDPQ_16110 [Nocardioidaceae bacterium]